MGNCLSSAVDVSILQNEGVILIKPHASISSSFVEYVEKVMNENKVSRSLIVDFHSTQININAITSYLLNS
jgi:hypothetical protein